MMSQTPGFEPYQTYYRDSTRRIRRNLMASSMIPIVLLVLNLKIESVGSITGWKIAIPQGNMWLALVMLGLVILYELLLFLWLFWNEYLAWDHDRNYLFARNPDLKIDSLVAAMQDITMLKNPQNTIDDVNKELSKESPGWWRG